MEMEAFPIRFTRGVRSHWRRSKYQRLEAGDGGGTRATSTKYLGGGRRRGGSGWGVRLRRLLRLLRRVRVVRAAPMRALRRVRDAYVGGMLAVARKASTMALPSVAPDEPWAKRAPRRKQQQQLQLLLPAVAWPGVQGQQPTAFEQRLILEIYKSMVASRELTSMLYSSVAHIQAS